jgi:hypothetical protein
MKLRPNYTLSRKWLALGQDLKILQAQLDFLRDGHIMYEQMAMKGPEPWRFVNTTNVVNTLDVLRSQCDICVRWVQVYRERTNTYINLVSEAHHRLKNRPL